MNYLTILGWVFGALSLIFLSLGALKSSQQDKTEIINSGIEQSDKLKEKIKDGNEQNVKEVAEIKKQITTGVKEVKAQITKTEKILISPAAILIPANASREVPVVITNNHSYPVFMVALQMIVENGELDMRTNFFLDPFYGGGFCGVKEYSCLIPQINAHSTLELIAKIDGNKYLNPSKIKISVDSYAKEPAPNFSIQQDSTELPTTIKVPENFFPERFPNK